ncbi:MAG: hypothetical protein KDI03_09655, partial [Anaerolineae bacterium]|nr:hypothetical protein [Anaerolineae bacterium]
WYRRATGCTGAPAVLEKIVTYGARAVKTGNCTVSRHSDHDLAAIRYLASFQITFRMANKCLVSDKFAARFLAETGLTWYNINSREDQFTHGRHLTPDHRWRLIYCLQRARTEIVVATYRYVIYRLSAGWPASMADRVARGD